MHYLNSLRPRRNRRYNADDIFKCIFLRENVWIPTKISLMFVPKRPINNIPALVQIMAWRRPGDKPLSAPMMVSLLTHICVTWSQWVKVWWPSGLTFICVNSHMWPEQKWWFAATNMYNRILVFVETNILVFMSPNLMSLKCFVQTATICTAWVYNVLILQICQNQTRINPSLLVSGRFRSSFSSWWHVYLYIHSPVPSPSHDTEHAMNHSANLWWRKFANDFFSSLWWSTWCRDCVLQNKEYWTGHTPSCCYWDLHGVGSGHMALWSRLN